MTICRKSSAAFSRPEALTEFNPALRWTRMFTASVGIGEAAESV